MSIEASPPPTYEKPTEEELQARRATKAKRTLEKRKQRAKVLELKNAGFTFDQIASEMGFKNRSSPYRIWAKAIAAIDQPKANQYRKQYDARTDRALRAANAVLATKDVDPRVRLQAADTVGRIERDRARVLGFELPMQHRHGGQPNTPPINIGVIDYGVLAELNDDDLAEAVEAAAATARAFTTAAAAVAPADGAGTPPPGAGED